MLKGIKYIFLTICIFCCAFSVNYGYTSNSGVLPRLMYIFMHANIFHLIVNLIGLNSMFNSISKIVWYPLILFYSIFLAFISSYLASSETCTIGSSGIVYFLIGLDLILRWSGSYFKIDVKKMSLYTFFIILMVLSTSLSSTVNYKLHLVNLFFGIVIGLYELLKNNRRKQKKSSQ